MFFCISLPAGSNWTPDEDAILKEAIRIYGERNWQQVAACMENRTGQQCLHRWLKSQINPSVKSGRWTTEEDQVNLFLLIIYNQ